MGAILLTTRLNAIGVGAGHTLLTTCIEGRTPVLVPHTAGPQSGVTGPTRLTIGTTRLSTGTIVEVDVTTRPTTGTTVAVDVTTRPTIGTTVAVDATTRPMTGTSVAVDVITLRTTGTTDALEAIAPFHEAFHRGVQGGATHEASLQWDIGNTRRA